VTNITGQGEETGTEDQAHEQSEEKRMGLNTSQESGNNTHPPRSENDIKRKLDAAFQAESFNKIKIYKFCRNTYRRAEH